MATFVILLHKTEKKIWRERRLQWSKGYMVERL